MLGKTLIVEPNNEILSLKGEYILISPKQLDLNAQGQENPNCTPVGTKPCSKLYQPLVMFVGGAMDTKFKPILSEVFPRYNRLNEHYQDIGYSTYKAIGALISLALHWQSKRQKVVLVGHSYGGDAVMDAARTLSDMGKDVELVITLDPVSMIAPRANQPKPKRVKRWLNIYVPYDKYRPIHDDFMNSETGYVSPKSKATLANDIAMLGSPWEECKYADYNRSFFTDTGDEYARTYEMFALVKHYVEAIK